MFVSCNPTLTSFFIQRNPYPKVFICPPNSYQCKTCIKHTFLTKKIMQFFFLPTYLPYFFPDRYRKQTIFFSWPKHACFLMAKIYHMPHWHSQHVKILHPNRRLLVGFCTTSNLSHFQHRTWAIAGRCFSLHVLTTGRCPWLTCCGPLPLVHYVPNMLLEWHNLESYGSIYIHSQTTTSFE